MSNLEDLFDKGLRTFLKPLTPFWEDSSVTGIFVNAPEDIWVERYGTLEQADVVFSTDQLYQAIRHIAQLSGVLISEENPQLHTMLPNGTEISIVLPPISRSGPVLAIHKATSRDRTLDELVEEGVLSRASGEFLLASLLGQQSMMIVGPPGSGKATLIRALVQYIPANERIVSVEQSTSQVFQHPHILHFALPSSDHRSDGRSKVSQTLLRALGSIRPNRILVERMGARSTLELMQVFRAGYPGSLATVRAHEPIHALQRIEAQCLSTQLDLPLKSLRAQLSSTFQLAIVCQRSPQGSSHVAEIIQLLPLDETGNYQLLPLFQRQANSSPSEAHSWEPGAMLPTGAIPTSWPILQRLGFKTIDRTFFHPGNYDEYGDRDETKSTPSDAIVGQAPHSVATPLPAVAADTPATASLLEGLLAKPDVADETSAPDETSAAANVAAEEPEPAAVLVPPPLPQATKAPEEPPKKAASTAPSPLVAKSAKVPVTTATPAASVATPDVEEPFPFLDGQEENENALSSATPSQAEPTPPPIPSEEANDALLFEDGMLESVNLDDTARQSVPPKQTLASPPVHEEFLEEPINPLEGNSFSVSSHELVDSPFHQPDPPKPQAPAPLTHQSTTVIAPVDPAASRRPPDEKPDWDNDPTYNPMGHHPATTQSSPLSIPTAQVPALVGEDTSQILDLSDIIDDLPNLVSEEEFRKVEEELRQQAPVRAKEPSTDMNMPQSGGPATRGGMLPADEIPTSNSSYLYDDEEPTQTGTGLQATPNPPPIAVVRPGAPPPSSPPPSTPRRGNAPHTPARSVVVRRGRRTNNNYDIGSFDVQETESTSIRARPPTVPKATRAKPDPAIRNQHPPSVEIPLGNNLSTEATVIRGRPVSPVKKK